MGHKLTLVARHHPAPLQNIQAPSGEACTTWTGPSGGIVVEGTATPPLAFLGSRLARKPSVRLRSAVSPQYSREPRSFRHCRAGAAPGARPEMGPTRQVWLERCFVSSRGVCNREELRPGGAWALARVAPSQPSHAGVDNLPPRWPRLQFQLVVGVQTKRCPAPFDAWPPNSACNPI